MSSALLLAWASLARAASCCALPGAASPAVLTPEEHVGVGVTALREGSVGDWLRDGGFVEAGELRRARSSVEVAALARVHPRAQLSVGVNVAQETLGPDQVVTASGLDRADLRLRVDRGRVGLDQRSPVLGLRTRLRQDGTLEGGVDLGIEGTRRTGPWSVGAAVTMSARSVRGELGARAGWSFQPGRDLLGGLSLSVEHAGTTNSVTPSVTLSSPLRVGAKARVIPGVAFAPPLTGLGRSSTSWATASLAVVGAR